MAHACTAQLVTLRDYPSGKARMSRPSLAPLLRISVPLLTLAMTAHAQAPAAHTAAYPGALHLDIDATDLSHRIFHAHERIPVQAGPLTLLYPRWLPGNHSPSGPLDKIAGIVITANGQRIDWQRDPLDVYAFKLDIPAGVSRIDVDF